MKVDNLCRWYKRFNLLVAAVAVIGVIVPFRLVS
jgi:hypothetical protein